MYTALSETKPLQLKPFHFMPAAVEYTNYGGLGAVVRYKKPTGDNRIIVREMQPSRALIQCPDRDLLLLRDTFDLFGYKPAEGVWDRYVPFSLYYPNAMEDVEMPFFMQNYVDYIKKPHNKSPFSRRNRERLPNEAYLVADSGGFQFMMGRFDWLDPRELVKWYNENIDIGMVLDIPPHGISRTEDLMKLARAQKKNTDLMMSMKRDSLEFFNIVHGYGENYDKYHDVVYDERIDRLAIGGAYIGSYMPSVSRLFNIIKRNSHRYKHVHVLGVWNLMQLSSILRFASHEVVDLITSDASSAIASANTKTYYYQSAIDSKWEAFSMGLSSKCYTPSSHVHLPCSCPVCETIKYRDIFSVLSGAMVTHMLAHHNMHAMNNYIERMYPIVAREDVKTITTLLECQLGQRSGLKEAMTAIRFADDMAAAKDDHELDRVTAKYSLYLNSAEVYGSSSETSLFDSDSQPNTEGDEEELSDDAKRKLAIADRFLSEETTFEVKENRVKPAKTLSVATSTKRTVKKGKVKK